MKRNENIAKLQAGYLFPEINRHRKALLEKEPNAKIISLGIGNTTEPLTPHITNGIKKATEGMATREGYSGYGDEQGLSELRNLIASKLYNNLIPENSVFVSDGAKCDIGRLTLLFGQKTKMAVQDPAYPAYVDSAVIAGMSEQYNKDLGQFNGIKYLPCTKNNNFFPDLNLAQNCSVIYYCSPNNPTGAVASHKQLEGLVAFAKKNNSIIVFDTAYAMFIKDESLPKTIYEIDGAKECAIEIGSFSKIAGFTGLRLGWSVVPDELKYECGHQVQKDWNRIACTVFNGASNVIQYGGIAALSEIGMQEMRGLVDFYMENARILAELLTECKIDFIGGKNSPYLWAHFPGKESWAVFQEILNKAHVVCTPGSGFGPAGEGYIRFSAFSSRENILEARSRLKDVLLAIIS